MQSRKASKKTSKAAEETATGRAKHRAVKASTAPSAPEVSSREIAELAHSYWVAGGHGHGSAEADWLRAEEELGAKR